MSGSVEFVKYFTSDFLLLSAYLEKCRSSKDIVQRYRFNILLLQNNCEYFLPPLTPPLPWKYQLLCGWE